MSAPISVIIPTLDSACSLPATFDSLVEGLNASLICEVVISDGGSKDATSTIALAWGAAMVEGPASRGGQLRRGVAASRGEWILVLHADTILQNGWSCEVQERLYDGPFCFSLGFQASGVAATLVAAWANLRTDFMRLPYGDQGLLVRRQDYERAGGYLEQPLMEDVAIVRALDPVIKRLRSRAFTDATKYQQQGWIWRGCKNLILVIRYFAGAKPEDLIVSYRSSGRPN